ncbi:hypothetical protein KM043_009724 [Ampulex compressa]|nr:hypothetical protein KM043_009724 [Ampulex compressa]
MLVDRFLLPERDLSSDLERNAVPGLSFCMQTSSQEGWTSKCAGTGLFLILIPGFRPGNHEIFEEPYTPCAQGEYKRRGLHAILALLYSDKIAVQAFPRNSAGQSEPHDVHCRPRPALQRLFHNSTREAWAA